MAAYLYFRSDEFDQQASLYGADPYPIGFKANRAMMEFAVRSEVEEGLLKNSLDVKELFCETTLDT